MPLILCWQGVPITRAGGSPAAQAIQTLKTNIELELNYYNNQQ